MANDEGNGDDDDDDDDDDGSQVLEDWGKVRVKQRSRAETGTPAMAKLMPKTKTKAKPRVSGANPIKVVTTMLQPLKKGGTGAPSAGHGMGCA